MFTRSRTFGLKLSEIVGTLLVAVSISYFRLLCEGVGQFIVFLTIGSDHIGFSLIMLNFCNKSFG